MSENDFEKELLKPMVCSFFAKTMKDVRDGNKLGFFRKKTEEKKMIRRHSQLNFVNFLLKKQFYDERN